MKPNPTPPAWIEAFLAGCLPVGEVRDGIVGDLREDFGSVAAVHGRGAATIWYALQAMRIGGRYVAGRTLKALSRPGRLVAGPGKRTNSQGGMTMDDVWRDIRLVFRGFVKSPGFFLVAILTLALGIGANTAIFSVVNGVLLKPLPFEDPDALVGVWHATRGVAGSAVAPMDEGLYFTYRDENRVFEDIGDWDNVQVSVTGLAEPEQLSAMKITAGLLPLLGVQPLIGRRFTEEDDSPGAPQTIMLGYAYWQRQFGADPGVIRSTLRVDGTPREIIGVLPPEFTLPRQETAIYIPFQWDRTGHRMGNFNGGQAIARLSPGVTIEEANADVNRMVPIAVERFPGIPIAVLEEIGFAANLRPLKQDFVGDVGNVLWVLLGTVGIVLVIACANVANLFLVRAEGRQREVAVRTALGAARSQLAQQFLLESLMLGLVGGLVGLGLAYGGVRLLLWMGPESLPRLNDISLDPRVLAFSLAISTLSGLVFGLVPVFRLGGLSVVATLKEGGRGGGVGKERHRARHALVVAQMALALVLLAGSGLMIRSFQALRNVDPGFANPEGVLTFRVAIPAAEIEDRAEVALAYESIWSRLREIPGVTSVGASTALTMDGNNFVSAVYVEDVPLDPNQPPPILQVRRITGSYFETIQNPILAGRPIEWADTHDRALVAVVTENFAEEHWGDAAAALGERIAWGDPYAERNWREIVGVVGDVHENGVDQPATPTIFWPMAMNMANSNDGTEDFVIMRTMAFAVRTSRPNPSSILPEVRAEVRAVNANFPLANVRTLDDILDRSMARTSFTLVLLAIAAVVALALGVVGIYGVISYTVSQRTREIGVRMALGADRQDVRRMVLRQGMILAGVGVAVGLVAALGLTRLMSSLLYGVEATDPVTFGVVAALLTAVALVASYLPALRASRTDPLEALRFE